MANDNEQCQSDKSSGLTPTQEVWLEGYKDLSRWNDRDEQSMIALDRLLITASVAATVLALAKLPGGLEIDYVYVYIPSVVVIFIWLLLSLRCKARLAARFVQMQAIERKLRFEAHAAIDWRSLKIKLYFPRGRDFHLPTFQDMWIRVFFFGLFVVAMSPPGLKFLRSLISKIDSVFN